MSSLTGLMFVVYIAFIIALLAVRPIHQTLVGVNEDTGQSHPWPLRLIAGVVMFPLYGAILWCLGWLLWKIGGLLILPFQYLYNLLPLN